MSSTPWYQRRSAAWVAVVLCGVVAAAMLWHGATEPRDRTTALVVGGFLASVTALLLAGLRRPIMRWEATRLDDRPAWTLRLGQPASALTLALVATSTTVLLGAWAASGGAGGVLLLGLPTLCFAVLTLEVWRIALVRRPRLTVGVDVVQLRSTGLDARMAWDDVRSVRYADSALHLAITLEAAAPAPSYRGRRRRWLLPTDRRPDPTRLPVRVTLVADPAALLTLLRDLHGAGASVRASRLAAPPPGR